MQLINKRGDLMLTDKEIDTDKLINSAKYILDNYQFQLKIKKRDESQMSAVEYSGMPGSPSMTNTAENGILRHVSAEDYVKEVDFAVDNLKYDNDLYKIIKYKYIAPMDTAIAIAMKLNISRSKYYRLLRKAQKEFGLLCKLVNINR